MLVYFVAIWYSLWPFGIFCGHLVYFVAIWYIPSCFGKLHQGKSGNPGSSPIKCIEAGAESFLSLFFFSA
jgi:hypothetical protein